MTMNHELVIFTKEQMQYYFAPYFGLKVHHMDQNQKIIQGFGCISRCIN